MNWSQVCHQSMCIFRAENSGGSRDSESIMNRTHSFSKDSILVPEVDDFNFQHMRISLQIVFINRMFRAPSQMTITYLRWFAYVSLLSCSLPSLDSAVCK